MGRMSKDHALVRVAAIALGLAGIPSAVHAQTSEADFFKGKTVSVVVAYPPGGGYDAYGRLFATHLSRHLPASPTVILRNMPGASGILAANYLYNNAPADGTVMAIFSSSAAFAPLFGNERAQFKTEKFTWLGVIDQTTSTCASWHSSGIRSFDDLLTRPAIFGAAASTALNSEHPRAFNALLGMHLRVIHGYPGGSSILLAMERGEVEALCSLSLSSLLSVRREDYEAHRLIPILQTGLKKHPAIPDVAHIYDYAKNDEERKIFHLLFGRHVVGRPIVAPPGLSPARTQTLRAAFEAVLKDPAFIAAAETQNLPIEPLTGEETETLVGELQATPAAIVKRVMEIVEVGKIENVQAQKLIGKIAKVSGANLQVTDAAGKLYNLRLSPEDSTIEVNGKRVEAAALRAEMSCRIEHFGERDIASSVKCE